MRPRTVPDAGAARSAPGAGPVRWLARFEDELPADRRWLAPAEAARLESFRFPKRRREYLLRRLAAKHAVVAVTGLPADPAALSRIEVANAPGGAPLVLVDGAPAGIGISLTDRAGWAVCAVGPDPGCDLELVEPRSPALVRTFFTAAERRLVAAGGDGEVLPNVIWSAKESALKVLGTGLARDTRSVEVVPGEPAAGGWGSLLVRPEDGGRLDGWWRRDGSFVLTVLTRLPAPPPVPLEDPLVLAHAAPRDHRH